MLPMMIWCMAFDDIGIRLVTIGRCAVHTGDARMSSAYIVRPVMPKGEECML